MAELTKEQLLIQKTEDAMRFRLESCPGCLGRGRHSLVIGSKPCARCGGRGYLKYSKNVEVTTVWQHKIPNARSS